MPPSVNAPPDKEAWRLLLPPHPDEHRTGALWLPPDPRDWMMPSNPDIAEVKATGGPASVDNRDSVLGIYDQGMEGSCVSWSDCSAVSTEGVFSGGPWKVLDGETFYHELGGTGQNGVDTRASLQRAVDLGIPIVNSNARVRIGSYFFASRDPKQFITDCEAAVAARKCVVVALLLPSPFGWESGDSPTSGYHQLDLVGYDPVWWIFANSWGKGFGRNGFARIKKAYIAASNLQNGYAYAAAVDSLTRPAPVPSPLPTPIPVPPPVVTRQLSALASGSGLSTLEVGQTVSGISQQGFAGSVVITQISDGLPTPAPIPTPTPTPTPVPVPIPTPTPTPTPGGLKVSVALGVHHVLSATVQGDNGTYVEAVCSLVSSELSLGTRQTHPVGNFTLPAVWVLPTLPSGTVIAVNAVSVDGRTGTGSVTV